MDLGAVFSLETELSDWFYWENKGELLKEATFTSYLNINDRHCKLTKHQKPLSVKAWQQYKEVET
jgi:hypothetical protein